MPGHDAVEDVPMEAGMLTHVVAPAVLSAAQLDHLVVLFRAGQGTIALEDLQVGLPLTFHYHDLH